MDSVNQEFTNFGLQIDSLPKHEEVEFNPISKRYLKKSFVQIGISSLFFLLGWGILTFFLPLLWLVLLVLAVIIGVFGFWVWNAVKLQKTYGYALREKDILYRRGYLVNRVTVIPFNRIQHVTIDRDIWDKRLNLATLSVYTAGGSGSDVSIPGLEPELAQRLKDALAEKISTDEER